MVSLWVLSLVLKARAGAGACGDEAQGRALGAEMSPGRAVEDEEVVVPLVNANRHHRAAARSRSGREGAMLLLLIARLMIWCRGEE